MQTPLFTETGFWQGEQATFTACIVIPKKNEEPRHMWWCNAFAGQELQGLEITYQGQTWIIANHDGTGYYKVTKGMGSPGCGHASFGDYDFVRYIPENEMITSINEFKRLKYEAKVEAYQKEKDPMQFERMQSLKRSLESFQQMTPAEQVKHIKNKNK